MIPSPRPGDRVVFDERKGPVLGPENAPVTIVFAYEYTCPHSAQVRPLVDELATLHAGRVRVLPRAYVVNVDAATPAALAACAASEQGRFREMDALLWNEVARKQPLTETRMMALAAELGLNAETFRTAYAGDCARSLRQDQADLTRVGVRGTPSFLVNGRFLVGGDIAPELRRVVAEELATAK